MVKLSLLFIALAAISANGAPLTKRIAQVIADSTQKWEQACLAAGGGEKCNPVSVTAFTTLLAAAGPCEQQNAADQMINLAKQLNNDPTMIKFTQIFAQQPRNTPSSESVQYCQQAPQNSELNGLFQCQFQGANPTTFVGGVKVGAQGTIPFGQKSPLSPPGSCPAHPQGPIADGTQLVDTVQNPGAPSGGGSGGGNKKGNNNGNGNGKGNSNGDSNNNGNGNENQNNNNASADKATPSNSSGGGFQLQNGKDAQALNAKFSTLSKSSTCQDGDQACIDDGFAQCVGGKFVITPCPSGTTCIALPLVNKPGTSIACTTQSDAEARIKATGATGGISG